MSHRSKAAGACMSLLVALALAACSGEPQPTESEVKELLLQTVTSTPEYQMMQKLAGETIPAPTFEKGDCVAATGATGVVCDIRATVSVNGKEQVGPWQKVRFFKVDGKWQHEGLR